MNVTKKQKSVMLNYMKDNPDFARDRLRYNGANKKILDDMWSNITNSLNSIGSGPQKQPKEWQKTWRDWKANVLKKCTQNKSYAMGTGGGPLKTIALTQLEEELMEILSPEAIGLDSIPQGGSFNRIKEKKSSDTISPQEESLLRNVQRVQASRIKEVHTIPTSTQTKRKCTSILINAAKIQKGTEGKNPISSTCSSTVVSNDIVDLSFDLDFEPKEIEPPEEYSSFSDTDTINEYQRINALTDENRKALPSVTIDCIPEHRTQQNKAKDRNENCARSAVQLMREKVEVLQEQGAFNKKTQERRNEIEEEKLKILKENIALKKQKFQFLQTSHSEYKDTLTNIDDNLLRLIDEVEKVVPSYLT
ncbi:uncharacterized protein LOC112459365 [Temnothorax curvispinosus]|uniref:Regulatory protein zeste n=1 Tax=Temnothorax curvispinosus TaxID=300111 RepID=A0A6J1QEP6_9HYME|nr:uncharacterized protein LOC112459365 [Temnothorax curvispinosus]